MRYAYRLFPTNRLFQQKILIFFLYTFLSFFIYLFIFFKFENLPLCRRGYLFHFFILNCLH